ncbi:DNA replication/repair protein RecF [Sandarakinorhabdus sp. DWP1-3-1]|uniref:DNA replication/repair protein RecF n=1 Tax=Sandarakinorhabdus sp. DWP1-3-1 TaxID=2804627 RepID=UPI003CF43F8C
MAAVTRLSLTDFRSYAGAEIGAAPGAVVITGDNGAGKTNILDALSLLGPGRGLRGAALSDAARVAGAGGWSIAATLVAPGGNIEIGTGISPQAPERRIVRINGAAGTATAIGEWLALVWLTPAMDRIFADTPAARRRFLDRLVLALHPGHAHESVRYEAAMRARTRLLTAETPADPHWLAALELAMAEHGAAVAAARADTLAALAVQLTAAPPGPFARPLIAIGGGEIDADFTRTLARGRAADATAGRALAGPHRSDMIVTHAIKGDPAARGSTGEQKALLVAIVLAHAELVAARTGQPPLLLLDEIAAHLDASRRAALFGRLAETGSQVWMTGTDPALFEAVDPSATRLQVEAGTVVSA